MGVYGTANNDTGTVFGFGNVTNTKFSKTDAAYGVGEDFVPAPGSVNKVYASGSLNPYGDYLIFAGRATDVNGVANADAGNLGNVAGALTGGLQKARKVGVDSIDRLTNVITYTSGSWELYDYVDTDGTSAVADVVANSIASPYSVPSKFSYLQEISPQTTTYSTSG